MKTSECFYLGYFKKTSGSNNLLTLEVDTDEPAKYEKLESVFVRIAKKDENLVPFFVKSVRSRKGNSLLLELETDQLVEGEKNLIGKEVYLPLSALPELKGNKFYFHEIVGFEVTDTAHGVIGNVKEVVNYPAQDVLRIHDGKIEFLVPLLSNTIVSVERENKKILIETPIGLVEMYRS